MRALEGALAVGEGRLQPGDGWTRIFITPGFAFRGAGALLTNFHLPRSTLLMMISALRRTRTGSRRLRRGDRSPAIGFFSYGDAMLIQ